MSPGRKLFCAFVTFLTLNTSFAQECWIQGSCDGILMGTEVANNKGTNFELLKLWNILLWMRSLVRDMFGIMPGKWILPLVYFWHIKFYLLDVCRLWVFVCRGMPWLCVWWKNLSTRLPMPLARRMSGSWSDFLLLLLLSRFIGSFFCK